MTDQCRQAIDVDLGTFGWLADNDVVVTFTLRQLLVHDLRLRTLRQASAVRYPCHPLTPRTWREFINANQP